MLEALRKAILGRRYGLANAELALRIERAVARMPREQASAAWRAWLWRLPPEAWQEAVDLRVLATLDLREAEARAMSRRGHAGTGSPEETEAIREASRQRQREILDRRHHFAERWGDPPA